MKDSFVPPSHPGNIELGFHPLGDMHVARYVSGTLVREEALAHGRMIGLYWSATGQVQRENVTATLMEQDNFGIPKLDPLAQPLAVFELEIDGQLLHNRWEWVGAAERTGARLGTAEAVIELRHRVRPITVKVVTRLDGSPVLARWLEITNTGQAPAALSHVSPWSGMLWNTDPAWNPGVPANGLYRLGYMCSEKWGEEGDFAWHALPQEHYRIERSNNRFHGSPYWVLRNELTGELCFVALAWSGNHAAEFAYRGNALSFRLGPLAPSPLRVIEPGEMVISPEVHLGMLHAGMDGAVHAWHQHIRASVLPPRPEGKEMYTIAARVVEQPGDWILKEIDIAAEMGCEAFMVDAGWYGEAFSEWYEHRGDWFEGDWLPGRMAGVRQHIHDKGMLFGLWLEPEAVTRTSKLYREHADWVLSTDDGREVGSFGLGLNLANPDAAKYVEDSIVAVIRDFKLDFYKTDYNITTYEGGQNLRDGYAEHESWRHFERLYHIYDRVRREYPQVALENCAGGGGRNDLGMMSRFHYCAESDYSSFPRSIRQINSMTLFLPPEALCYYHNHIPMAHQTADLETHLRVTLFATPIYVGFGAQNADRSGDYFETTRRYIELAKTFCRPIMAHHPAVHHHTPDIGLFNPADWCVLEYAAQDRTRAYAGVFRLSGHGTSEYLFRPRGLDLAREYTVTLDNSRQRFRLSGRELAHSGLSVRLDAALTSELLLFEAIHHDG
ncbi:MAG: alpha-galactosidase [Chloroflexi bacterium]|nr:alpha-galactosidase [Chloroflexota bacterium]